jgi:hypothetical protein
MEVSPNLRGRSATAGGRCPQNLGQTMKQRKQRGQSLVETVLMMPFLLFLMLNTLNFGYFFLTFVNLTASTRTGVEYAIQGSSAIPSTSLPPAGDTPAAWPPTGTKTVAYVVYYDMVGAMFNPDSLAAVQVCSPSILNKNNIGYDSNGLSNCQSYGTLPSGYAWPTRPAATNCLAVDNNCGATNSKFVMAEVYAMYQYAPLIPGSIWNVFLVSLPVCQSTGGGNISCVFTRTTKMRTMGY